MKRNVLTLAVGAIIVFGWCVFSSESTFASAAISCSDKIKQENESIRFACESYDGSTGSRGAMWINGSGNDSTSSTVDAEQSDDGDISAYLVGAFLSNGTVSMDAENIEFVTSKVPEGSGLTPGDNATDNGYTAVDYIVDIGSTTLNRGTGGTAGSWSTGYGSIGITIKYDNFIDGATLDDDGYYSREVEVYRCPVGGNECYSSTSTIRIKALPPPEDFTLKEEYKGQVKASATNSSGKSVSVESGWGSEKSGEIVTRDDSMTVTFNSYMCKVGGSRVWTNQTNPGEDIVKKSVNFTPSPHSHWSTTPGGHNGDYAWADGKKCSAGGSIVEESFEQKVEGLAVGESKEVCNKIDYEAEVTYDFTRKYRNEAKTKFKDTLNNRTASNGSAKACVTVKRPYNYDTTTTAGINSSAIVSPGSSVSAQYSINTTERKNAAEGGAAYKLDLGADGYIKKVAVFTIDNSVAAPSERLLKGSVDQNNTNGDLCARMRDLGARNCNEENFNATKNITIPDLPVGTKVCTVSAINHADSHGFPNDPLSANPSDANYGANAASMSRTNNTHWRISPMACKTVGMRPNFSIMNSGFYTSGNVNASVTATDPSIRRHDPYFGGTTAATTLYGSWVEYPLIVGGDSFGIASAAGLGLPNGRGGTTTTPYFDYSKMSIDNTTSNAANGRLTSSAISGTDFVKKVKDRFKGMTDGTAGVHTVIRSSGDSNDEFVVENRDSNMTLGETHQTSGSRVIIVDGTLTITGNICYDDSCSGDLSFSNRSKNSYNRLSDLPQLVLVANNIKINDNVDQIDAWLISTGNIDTCGNVNTSDLTSAVCNKTLLINGPVVAQNITLDRTNVKYGEGRFSGSGVVDSKLDDYGSATAAEVLSFNPSAWIWAMYQAQREEYATTTYMNELAPRL